MSDLSDFEMPQSSSQSTKKFNFKSLSRKASVETAQNLDKKSPNNANANANKTLDKNGTSSKSSVNLSKISKSPQKSKGIKIRAPQANLVALAVSQKKRKLSLKSPTKDNSVDLLFSDSSLIKTTSNSKESSSSLIKNASNVKESNSSSKTFGFKKVSSNNTHEKSSSKTSPLSLKKTEKLSAEKDERSKTKSSISSQKMQSNELEKQNTESQITENKSQSQEGGSQKSSKGFKFKKVTGMKPFVVFDIVSNTEKLSVDEFTKLNQSKPVEDNDESSNQERKQFKDIRNKASEETIVNTPRIDEMKSSTSNAHNLININSKTTKTTKSKERPVDDDFDCEEYLNKYDKSNGSYKTMQSPSKKSESNNKTTSRNKSVDDDDFDCEEYLSKYDKSNSYKTMQSPNENSKTTTNNKSVDDDDFDYEEYIKKYDKKSSYDESNKNNISGENTDEFDYEEYLKKYDKNTTPELKSKNTKQIDDEFLLQNIVWSDDELDLDEDKFSAFPDNVGGQNWNDSQQNDYDYDLSSTQATSSKASTNIAIKARTDNTKEFQGVYPFTEVMREVLSSKFGLKDYRPGQQEIINACLEQHDVFVLMPTGGGKSLCYQLPAILTPGVTIVISPLRALIGDQVDKLNSLDIPAAHLCADVKDSDKNIIFTKLAMLEPGLKLLYLTPEKIIASPSVSEMIKGLYKRNKLARIVIDEVHCMSQWGHDFRPDYKKMSILRTSYPGVPFTCLTATATKLVEADVLSILKLKNVKTFITSFNRTNIKYSVFLKDKEKIDREVAYLIRKNFPSKSGIIYCLCRKDCEVVAEKMCGLGVKARPYHAGMSATQREKQQRDWMNNVFHVVVATIAFGMGIDKPDVRFVIHYSIPKTVEAFYQESGRAGRDGEIAYSYLFYNTADVVRLKKLIQMDKTAASKTLQGHLDNVDQMLLYADNKVDCRRQLLLAHLGEEFNRDMCIKNKSTACDNCLNAGKYITKDVTKESYEIAKLIKDLCTRENLTILHIIDCYTGKSNKKIVDKNHNKHVMFGKGANVTKPQIQRIIRNLINRKVVAEHSVCTGYFPVMYIKPGPEMYKMSTQNEKFTLTVSKEPERVTSVLDDIPSTSTSGQSSYQVTQLKDKCHEELLELCTNFASKNSVTISSVMNLQAIKYMSQVLPSNEEEFKNIQYVTRANYEKYGKAFLEITKKYKQKINDLKPSLDLIPVDKSFNKDDWKTNMPKKRTNYKSGRKGTKRKQTYRRGGARKKRKSM